MGIRSCNRAGCDGQNSQLCTWYVPTADELVRRGLATRNRSQDPPICVVVPDYCILMHLCKPCHHHASLGATRGEIPFCRVGRFHIRGYLGRSPMNLPFKFSNRAQSLSIFLLDPAARVSSATSAGDLSFPSTLHHVPCIP